ncbi:DUF2061 domain-containing protein [Oceanihabitans sp. IOP_32]|uniref:DUF2061 domain-containing protein n=1 Tax=Oceanihabitans sp. IOP_32 TaxID=2529032 RepID=UPI0012935032|nr:DUF2061 domain-containing protein [Oceanihabitans sp. IOP_32]QFZ55098.1 DUF2061 domain-containing protein [Oceanihabitans sp. IOP_32]
MIIDAIFSRKNKNVKVTDINNSTENDVGKKTNKSEEKVTRSLAKTISWRIIGTLDTLILSWLITGEVVMAFTIASVEFGSKLILYFFHERVWNIIKWGK